MRESRDHSCRTSGKFGATLDLILARHRGVGDRNSTTKSETRSTPMELPVMGHSLFREGDKVIQTRNNYDRAVFNGDMGVIDSSIQ